MDIAGIQNIEQFIVAGIVLNLIPGPDTFFILGRSLSQGTKSGVAAALGISCGGLGHTLAAAVGLSAIIATSEWAFYGIKLVGSLYLIYLGLKLILSKPDILSVTGFENKNVSVVFKQGCLTNLLNPKVALFFLAFLPQFISPETSSFFFSFLLLGLLFVLSSTIWCVLLAYYSAKFSRGLRNNPDKIKLMNKLTGGLLMILGVKLALER